MAASEQSPKTPTKSSSLRHSLLSSSALRDINPSSPWLDLRVPPKELRCSLTLTTGQSFNWRSVSTSGPRQGPALPAPPPLAAPSKTAWGSLDAAMWLGVVFGRVIVIEETAETTRARLLAGGGGGGADLRSFLAEYFQLGVSLEAQYEKWERSSPDYFTPEVSRMLAGVRVLAQDPWETLLCFITSSNNNIPRIHKLMEDLRSRYGDLLLTVDGGEGADPIKIHAYPTLEQLAAVKDEEFRALGFGYRAKFFVGMCELLRSADSPLDPLTLLPAGNPSPTIDDIAAALQLIPGVGRKVADCVALFSLGLKAADVVPVDTHIFQMAARWEPSLLEPPKKRLKKAKGGEGGVEGGVGGGVEEGVERGGAEGRKEEGGEKRAKPVKISITDKVYKKVGEVFRKEFPGGYAGWAHSVLFLKELPSFKGLVRDKEKDGP